MTSDELRALADAATPGPWWLAFYTEVASSAVPDAGTCRVAETSIRPDARLITTLGVAETSIRPDARLIAALGPDVARVFADAIDALRDLGACNDPDCDEPQCLHVLARFEALGA